MPDKAHLYVFTRRDLPSSVAACQSIHAASNLTFHHKDKLAAEWGHYGPTLVLCGELDEPRLRDRLRKLGDEAVPFFEPDLLHELTAVAYYGRLKRDDLRLL